MKNNLQDFELDAMSTDELNELLNAVMVKLRLRDAAELKRDFISKSGRLTRPEKIDRHLSRQ